MRLSNRTKGLIVVLILAAVIVLGFAVRKQRASTGEFFTSVAEAGPLRNVVNATGVVQTVVTVQVGSQVSGQVEELYADYNSVVKHNQLLAKLDPRNFQAQLENSEAAVASAQAHVQSAEAELKTQAANLASAKANLEAARVTRDNTAVVFQRNAELTKEGVVSKNDYDNAKANADSSVAKYDQADAAVAQAEAQSRSASAGLQQAKAQLQQAEADLNRAKLNLEYCNIYSPVDGVVISRNIDVGQTIAASLQSPTLFTIANDLTRMQVNANVDEADIGNISDQADVRFTVDAFPNDVLQGADFRDPAEPADRTERRDLQRHHRHRQSGPEIETGHDGQHCSYRRPARSRVESLERGVALCTAWSPARTKHPCGLHHAGTGETAGALLEST